MIAMTNEELRNVQGGTIETGTFLAISAGIVFLIGVIDGYLRPLKCNS